MARHSQCPAGFLSDKWETERENQPASNCVGGNLGGGMGQSLRQSDMRRLENRDCPKVRTQTSCRRPGSTCNMNTSPRGPHTVGIANRNKLLPRTLSQGRSLPTARNLTKTNKFLVSFLVRHLLLPFFICLSASRGETNCHL
jgi:hypothetical protein